MERHRLGKTAFSFSCRAAFSETPTLTARLALDFLQTREGWGAASMELRQRAESSLSYLILADLPTFPFGRSAC